MKSFCSGLASAFSMYSVFPAPHTEWTDGTMKYAMCFFPLVGVLIGAAAWVWMRVCGTFALNAALASAVLALLPAVLSGGIHLDGLIDTGDAIGSHADREKKLEILKDSHVGAFGVLFCAGYFLLYFGFASQFFTAGGSVFTVCLGFVLSRGYSSLAVVSFPSARNTGLVRIFADSADKKTVRAVSVVWIAAASAAMILLAPFAGTVCAAACFVWFWLFRLFCLRGFGGLTGDLAGFALCASELLTLACASLCI